MTCSFIDFNITPSSGMLLARQSNGAKFKIIPVQSNRYHKWPCKEIVGMENFSVTHKTVVSPLKSVEQHQQQKVEIRIYCLVFQNDSQMKKLINLRNFSMSTSLKNDLRLSFPCISQPMKTNGGQHSKIGCQTKYTKDGKKCLNMSWKNMHVRLTAINHCNKNGI